MDEELKVVLGDLFEGASDWEIAGHLRFELRQRQYVGIFDDWIKDKNKGIADYPELNPGLREISNSRLAVFAEDVIYDGLDWHEASEISQSTSQRATNRDSTGVIVYDFHRWEKRGEYFVRKADGILRDKRVSAIIKGSADRNCADEPTFSLDLSHERWDRFREQPYLRGTCSAFVVKQNYILTAGHCYYKSCICGSHTPRSLENAVVMFGYNKVHDVVRNGQGEVEIWIHEDRIKRITQMAQVRCNPRRDWAIFEIEDHDQAPLELGDPGSLEKCNKLYQMGHPLGLPFKLNTGGEYHSTIRQMLITTLDSFTGNSGSPVCIQEGKNQDQVVGLTVKGDCDFIATGPQTAVPLTCRQDYGDCNGERVQSIGPIKPIIDSLPDLH
ncbi:MAG: serine protease [Bacteroidota bacterium]